MTETLNFNHNSKRGKLALSGVALLGLSVFAVLFSKLIVNDLAYRLLLASDFASVEALNVYTFAFSVLGYFFMAVGACLFVYLGVTSRFHVDRQRMQTQARKLRVVFVVVACGLVAVSLFSTALVQGNSMATTGYYLATPYSPYDWLIARYSTGTVYAINGSNWANMMTWPSTAPWLAYAGNNSAVVEAALAATSAGTLYLKEVSFDYGLTVPDNVQVIENVNGLTRTFVASSATQGSPYTISVDTVNSTYYLAQDGAGRYIDSWTSINSNTTISSVFSALENGETVYINRGNYSDVGFVISIANVTLCGDKGAVLIAGSTQLEPVITINGADTVKINGLVLEGQYATQDAPNATNMPDGIRLVNSDYCQITENDISGFRRYGVFVDLNSDFNKVYNNKITYCEWNPATIGYPATNNEITDNTLAFFHDVGASTYGNHNLVARNRVHDGNWGRGYNNASWGVGDELNADGGNNTFIENEIFDVLILGEFQNTHPTVKGNIGYNWNINDNWDYAFIFNNNADASQVTGNDINSTRNTSGGIKFDSDDNYCAGNTVTAGAWSSNWIQVASGKTGNIINLNNIPSGKLVDEGTGTAINNVINRLKGVSPTQSGWANNAANPTYGTDGNWSTATGLGNKTLTGAGVAGISSYDMGAAYLVTLRGAVIISSSAGETIYCQIITSLDNTNWNETGGYYGQNVLQWVNAPKNEGIPEFTAYARYIRVQWGSTAVTNVQGGVAELEANQIVGINTPV